MRITNLKINIKHSEKPKIYFNEIVTSMQEKRGTNKRKTHVHDVLRTETFLIKYRLQINHSSSIGMSLMCVRDTLRSITALKADANIMGHMRFHDSFSTSTTTET